MYPESLETKQPDNQPAADAGQTPDDGKVTVNRAELMAIIKERDHFRAICGDLSQDIASFIINGKALLGPFIGGKKKPNPLTLVSEIMSKAGQLEVHVIPIVALFEKYDPMVSAMQQLPAEHTEP